MRIKWEADALQDYVTWQTNKAILKRINLLIKEIQREPLSGIGKPEALKYDLSGYWSRRIDDAHRLVYVVDNEVLTIVQCRVKAMNTTWDGVERRGKPKKIRDFSNSREVFETLMAAVEKARADGHNMIANRSHWHDVGDYVLSAAERAETIIRSIDRMQSAPDYAMNCRAVLTQEADRYLDLDSDPASFYGPTVYEIIRSIEVG